MAARAALRKGEEEDNVLEFDEYGFLVPVSKLKLHKTSQADLKKINARVEKWRKMLPNIETLLKAKDKKLKERIRKGIPNGIRLKVWPHLSKIHELKLKYANKLVFQALVDSPEFPYEIDIAADLKRTFPNHQLFMGSNKSGLVALNNVLKAVSIANPDLGYCQGLNFIAAAFMIYLSDEESFFTIMSLLENYDCEKMFVDVGSIRRQLFIHDALVKKFLPEIAELLNRYNVDSLTFGTGWYMTLFSSTLPFDYFLRIMDVFFAEKWKIIYRVALALLKYKKKRLLAVKSFEEVYVVLKDFREFENGIVDQDKFFKSAFSDFSLSKALIADLEKQYEIANPPKQNKKPNRPLEQQIVAIKAENKEEAKTIENTQNNKNLDNNQVDETELTKQQLSTNQSNTQADHQQTHDSHHDQSNKSIGQDNIQLPPSNPLSNPL